MSIKIGVLYDQIRWEEKAVVEAAKKGGLQVNLIDSKSQVFNLTEKNRGHPLGDVILQRSISFFRNLHSTAALESQGYSVVNNFGVTNTCGNKLLSTIAFMKKGVPTPKTFVAFTTDSALAAMEKVRYPGLLKPVVGSWGRMIVPLKDRETAQAIFEEREYMFPLYHVYYLQELVKRPPRDIRTFVIGEEVVAGIYRYSFGDIKTNIARGGKAEYCKITDEIREMSIKASEAVGGGILGVDMMETKNGLLVHEVNHTVEFQATVATTGVDLPKYIVGYLLRKVRK